MLVARKLRFVLLSTVLEKPFRTLLIMVNTMPQRTTMTRWHLIRHFILPFFVAAIWDSLRNVRKALEILGTERAAGDTDVSGVKSAGGSPAFRSGEQGSFRVRT
jgi:hypothetical protein